MENNRYLITFKTSASQDDKDAGDTTVTTTTIVFAGWTDEDFKVAAAETVKIRQIQPKIRLGKAIGPEFIASRPGTRVAVVIDFAQALVKVFGGDNAMLLIKKYGSAEKAYVAIKPQLDALMADVESDPETSEDSEDDMSGQVVEK